MLEDLRRTSRVSFCCRVVVRDRFGVWTAVTENLGARGCGLVTPRLLRAGSIVHLTLSCDLFPDELEVTARTAWATPERLGLDFIDLEERAGALSPKVWLDKVLEHCRAAESDRTRLVPCIRRRASDPTGRSGRLVRTKPSGPPRAPARRA